MRFDRDRWYSSENRKAIRKRAYQNSSGTRRVISLAFLLAMILVVMQRLNDPAKYEPAFRAIGLANPSKTNGTSTAKVLDQKGDNPDLIASTDPQDRRLVASDRSAADVLKWVDLALAAANPDVDRYAQIWESLLQLASPEVVSELAETFFQAERLAAQQSAANQPTVRPSDGSAVISSESVSAALPAGLSIGREDAESSKLVEVSAASRLWLTRANERVAHWLEAIKLDNQEGDQVDSQLDSQLDLPGPNTLGEFPSQWTAWSALTEGGVPAASAALSDQVRQGLRIALDRRLLKSVRDASPWRPVERPALLRTLQRAVNVNRSIEATNPNLQSLLKVEVPLLTKQANDLRGRLVRLRGRPISNVTTTEANSETWGNFAYDVLWIYPDDNSQQPVCIYAIKSPAIKSTVDQPAANATSIKSPEHRTSPQGISSSPAGGWPTLKAEQIGKINANSASVEVTGFFVKRLAFASPRGVDIAPVLIVSHSRWVDDVQADNLADNQTGMRTDPSASINFLSKSEAPVAPWREPGIHRSQLRLLSEVLAEPIQMISEDVLSVLTEPTWSPNQLGNQLDDEPDKSSDKLGTVLQVLYQLPRLQKPLMGAIDSNKKVGSAKLARQSGIALEWLPIPLNERQAIAIGHREVYRVKVQPIEPARASSIQVNDEALSSSGSDTNPFIYAFVNRIPSHWKKTHSNENKIWQPVMLEGLVLDRESTRNQVMLCDAPNWSWRWADMSDPVNPEPMALATSIDTATVSQAAPAAGADGSGKAGGHGELTMSKPIELNIQPSISIDWQQLGAAGWDLSGIRFIQSMRGKTIAAEEATAFYSLIDAADRISASPRQENHSTISPFEALQGGPSSVLGRVGAKVRIIRVTRIDVPEESNRRNLDGNVFYELDGLADIGNQVIQLKSPDGSGDIRFAGRFPMTLVTKSVPDWLLNNSTDSKSKISSEQNLQQGVWYPSVNVDIEGIFYRLWSYSTGQTAKASENMEGTELRQIGPLVAVTEWKSLPTTPPAPQPARSLVREFTTALIVAAAIVWFFYRFRIVKK
ncbi:MAG: hypothetical protein NTW52_01875 [Planctomycetota bacterium]|nr:hypothetical protein [Planctomycetota bacterium]